MKAARFDALSLYTPPRAQTDRHGRYRAIISVRPALNERTEVWHVVHDTCDWLTQTLRRTALPQGLQGLLLRPSLVDVMRSEVVNQSEQNCPEGLARLS